jgi:hypothetical protein
MCPDAIARGTPCPQNTWTIRQADIIGEKCLRCVFDLANDRRMRIGREAYMSALRRGEIATIRDILPLHQTGSEQSMEEDSELIEIQKGLEFHHKRCEDFKKASSHGREQSSKALKQPAEPVVGMGSNVRPIYPCQELQTNIEQLQNDNAETSQHGQGLERPQIQRESTEKSSSQMEEQSSELSKRRPTLKLRISSKANHTYPHHQPQANIEQYEKDDAKASNHGQGSEEHQNQREATEKSFITV